MRQISIVNLVSRCCHLRRGSERPLFGGHRQILILFCLAARRNHLIQIVSEITFLIQLSLVLLFWLLYLRRKGYFWTHHPFCLIPGSYKQLAITFMSVFKCYHTVKCLFISFSGFFSLLLQ